jgi:hypothetical protein
VLPLSEASQLTPHQWGFFLVGAANLFAVFVVTLQVRDAFESRVREDLKLILRSVNDFQTVLASLFIGH